MVAGDGGGRLCNIESHSLNIVKKNNHLSVCQPYVNKKVGRKSVGCMLCNAGLPLNGDKKQFIEQRN